MGIFRIQSTQRKLHSNRKLNARKYKNIIKANKKLLKIHAHLYN